MKSLLYELLILKFADFQLVYFALRIRNKMLTSRRRRLDWLLALPTTAAGGLFDITWSPRGGWVVGVSRLR